MRRMTNLSLVDPSSTEVREALGCRDHERKELWVRRTIAPPCDGQNLRDTAVYICSNRQ